MNTAKNRKRSSFLAALAASAALLLAAAPASAAPEWEAIGRANSTVAPASDFNYIVAATNVGDQETGFAQAQVVATLPAGVTATGITVLSGPLALFCEGDAPGGAIDGASVISCLSYSANFMPFHKAKVSAESAVFTIQAHAGPLAAGTEPIAHVDVYGPAGSVLSDGTPCSASPPGVPCASTAIPLRVSSSPAAFGPQSFDLALEKQDRTPDLRAGAHPYAQTVSLDFETKINPTIDSTVPGKNERWPSEPVRDILVDLPPGFLGSTVDLPRCSFVALIIDNGAGGQQCPPASQVGVATVRSNEVGPYALATTGVAYTSLYNMYPSPGAAATFALYIAGVVGIVDVKLRPGGHDGLVGVSRMISQSLPLTGTELTFWGDPADESHRSQRGCPGIEFPSSGPTAPTCPGAEHPVAFLRNPTSCTPAGQGLLSAAHVDSWWNPATFKADGSPDLSDPRWKSLSSATHELPGFPYPPAERGAEVGIEGCGEVPVKGTLSAQPTSRDTETPSGLAVHVEVPNPGFDNPAGIASSDIKAVKVALPEGLTVNPSQAEGLGVCSPAQYESSALTFAPENPNGCPADSKIGTVEVHSPALEETIPGNVYIAKPYDNPFGSLLALYIVLEEPQRGILVTLPGKVETDEKTGQITTTFDDLPQVPFSSFDFHFREGARAPLVTPQACGTYQTVATFTPWSVPSRKLTSKSSFTIDRGIGGGACPSGATPPFHPGLIAGSLNNAAGAYSPFNVRLFRTDAEQEFTNFSIKLPRGVIGKLAGVPFCSDAAIAAAKSPLRMGADELASPSCPAASQIGRTMAGAGVGSVLTYAPGKLYLAGPYHGSQLSIVSITAAKVGPFDLGTVVVRLALRINPETAEVFVDATGSDPLPHLIKGITVHLRDIRAYVDRPDFTLNPTSCERTSTASTLLGSGLDFFSASDDQPVTVSTPYQAADCSSLGFKPRLKLSLKGGTKRSDHPALRAVLLPRPGDANIGRVSVALPHSEFLAQGHIRTVCTRVQFAAGAGNGAQCPPGSIYGRVRAWTPLLDEPLEGPVFLRSSEHPLPDLVLALHGLVDFDAVGRIDSVNGGIRNTFEAVPDAPISKVVVDFAGGRKGLLENSTNLCARAHRATVKMDGHNGKIHDTNPVLSVKCAKGKKAKKRAPRAR